LILSVCYKTELIVEISRNGCEKQEVTFGTKSLALPLSYLYTSETRRINVFLLLAYPYGSWSWVMNVAGCWHRFRERSITDYLAR